MTILTHKILESQAFPVLRTLSGQISAIRRLPARAFMGVARDVATSARVDPKTIRHLFMHRLGFGSAATFYTALVEWAEGRPTQLATALKTHAPPDMHTRIEQLLTLPPTVAEAPSRLRDAAAAPIAAPTDDQSVVLRNLDSGTMFVLRSMAGRSGRSIDDEAQHLLIEALHARRDEAIRWADELRASLVGRYSGDSTADIRADRDRW